MNKPNIDKLAIELDEEEQEISVSLDKAIDSGELTSVDHVAQRMAEAKQIATNTLRKVSRP